MNLLQINNQLIRKLFLFFLILFTNFHLLLAQENLLDKYSVEEIFNFLQKEDPVSQVEPEFFEQYLFYSIYLFGLTGDRKLEKPILILYFESTSRLTHNKRKNLYQLVVNEIDQGSIGVIALFPFLTIEQSRDLVSRAVLDFLMYRPVEKSGDLDGVKEILIFINHVPYSNKGALLGGLLLTGDQRVIDSIHPYIPELTNKEIIDELVKTQSSYTYIRVVDFYLHWLETINKPGMESEFGGLAAGLIRMLRNNDSGLIVDVERDFGLKGNMEPVRLIQSQTIREYFSENKSRFEKISNAERGEKIMPLVIEEWESW